MFTLQKKMIRMLTIMFVIKNLTKNQLKNQNLLKLTCSLIASSLICEYTPSRISKHFSFDNNLNKAIEYKGSQYDPTNVCNSTYNKNLKQTIMFSFVRLLFKTYC